MLQSGRQFKSRRDGIGNYYKHLPGQGVREKPPAKFPLSSESRFPLPQGLSWFQEYESSPRVPRGLPCNSRSDQEPEPPPPLPNGFFSLPPPPAF